MLTTDQKGAIAESAIVHAAVKLGIGVYLPFAEGERYDLILDLGGRLQRVQCKWAPLYRDVVVVRAYSTRRTAHGLRRRTYSATEIDGLAAYCPDLDRCTTSRASALSAAVRSSSGSRRVETTKRDASTAPRTLHSSGYDSTLPGP
jgi:hypothetical protein